GCSACATAGRSSSGPTWPGRWPPPRGPTASASSSATGSGTPTCKACGARTGNPWPQVDLASKRPSRYPALARGRAPARMHGTGAARDGPSSRTSSPLARAQTMTVYRGPSFQFVEEITSEDLTRRGGFGPRTTPLLVKGAVRAWPAWERWSFESLSELRRPDGSDVVFRFH